MTQLKWILEFVTLACVLLTFAETSGTVRDVEKSILDYHNYIGGWMWKWNSTKVEEAVQSRSREYNFICSPGYDFRFSPPPRFIKRNVMLESQECARIEMEIFECACDKKEDGGTSHEYYDLARGVNGEMYQVAPPYAQTACDDRRTPVIKRCVNNGASVPKDVSEIEMFIYINRDIFGSQEWDSPDSTCKLLKPDFTRMKVDRMAITLQAVSCAEIRMTVLYCERGEDSKKQFIRGKNNEVFEVSMLYGKNECKKPSLLTVEKRVIDHKGNLVQPLCPK